MAKFRFDEDDTLVADEHGDLDYDDAINAIVEEAVASMEHSLWNMVDELEYVMTEEAAMPTNEDLDDGSEYEAD